MTILGERTLDLLTPSPGKIQSITGSQVTGWGGRLGSSNPDPASRGVAFPLQRNYALFFSLLVALLLAAGSAPLSGATYNSNGSLADVIAKEASASNGDTITLPAGTFTWPSYFETSKAITLAGAGIGNTIVIDAGNQYAFIQWTLVAGKPSRLTGIEFRDGGTRTGSGPGNLIPIFGSNTNGSTMRVDHCRFDHLKGVSVCPSDMIGVIDHCTFLYSAGWIPIYAFHKNWNNQGPYAGGSWADSSHFGTDRFLFIEDSIFNCEVADSTSSATIGTGSKTFAVQAFSAFTAGQGATVIYPLDPTKFMKGTVTSYSGTTLVLNITSVGGSGTFGQWEMITDISPNYAPFDCYGGARMVFRHNKVTRGHIEIHGTELIFRGGRAFEIYNNTFIGPSTGNYIINGRSGIFVVHDNVATGFPSGPTLELTDYRVGENVLWEPGAQADGTSRWDVNDTEGNGTNVPGHSPYLFYSGTAISGTLNGGSYSYPTVTVSGSPWTVNQWKGYSIKKTSADVATVKASYILENTSNTITFIPVIHPPTISFANGDTFQIHRVLHAMDQCGRSQGSLIPQTDPASPPNGWNDQVTEPCYEWNNTKTEGGSFHFDSDPIRELVRANEHYFNSTVKPGYTPFNYPHPLTTGSTQPNAPSNLRITGP